MKILITGSSGYIGRHLCHVLQDEDVTGLDKFYRPQITKHFIQQNILDSNPIEDEYDVVVHLAALIKVGQSMKCPMEYYKNNVTGTLKVLENIKTKNFIFASTGAAEFPHFCSPYALSKLQTEALVRQYCTLNNIDFTIFRFYNVIGSIGYETTNVDGLMYNLIKAKETGEFNIFGNNYDTIDGTAVRDYVHVLEICRAIQFAIKRPSNLLIENLGSGTGYSVQKMVDTFKKVNGVDFKVNYLPRREGDLQENVLKNVSPYMQKTFTIEQMLRI